MIGAGEEEEVNQFYIVNSTAKSVKTDLALALLKTRVDADHGLYLALQARGREWQADGQGLVERMAHESLIWKHRIRLPSMEKGETTISSASLVSSLKPLLNSPFADVSLLISSGVLEAISQAVREVLREAFDNPKEFSVQKGVGVIVLHSIMLNVLEIVRTRGLLPTEPESYIPILKPALTKLEGENADGNPVAGVEFWAAAPRGAAGSYSSSAGRRVLLAKIRQLLPAVELD